MDKKNAHKGVLQQLTDLESRVLHIKLATSFGQLDIPPETLTEIRNVFGKFTTGKGLIVLSLWSGERDKSLVTEAIASVLHRDLYCIDVRALVSKYIGETEKNLEKMFDAAEQSGAILFVDEADAIFGNRSEVKDSHDRYTNIEVSYLLQRIESFSGLAILATNMKSAHDQTFMRRIRFIVNFPFPGVVDRTQIWQKALAPEVPRDALDYERLARLNLSGGKFHSITLNAAFTAAGPTSPTKPKPQPKQK